MIIHRLAKKDDLSRILELADRIEEDSSHDLRRNISSHFKWSSSPFRYFLFSHPQHNAVSYLAVGDSFLNDTFCCSLDQIAVDKNFSNQGIGLAMLEQVPSLAKEAFGRPFTHVGLYASGSSYTFYEKHGFSLVDPHSPYMGSFYIKKI